MAENGIRRDTHSEEEEERGAASYPSDVGKIKPNESSIFKQEGEVQAPVLEVEKVINTDDLVCPTCKTRITTRVTLKMKKIPDPVPVPILRRILKWFAFLISSVKMLIDKAEIDIAKSIVRGGLLECIASLTAVSSAAAADATTLNILASGAANMIGGLFVLAHDLRSLKGEKDDERYEEALGRRGHFALQSTFAVISYLVFGLLPPVIYRFTFRESDNQDYKLIAVVFASLLCILLLSFTKAYTCRANQKGGYMKMISEYVGLWVLACGVSYVTGRLVICFGGQAARLQ